MIEDIAREIEKLAEDFGIDKKRTIREAAEELAIEASTVKMWEENFPQIKAEIGKGNRKYYYNKQIKILRAIKTFLHEKDYKINELQSLLEKYKQDQTVERDENLDIITAENCDPFEAGQDDCDLAKKIDSNQKDSKPVTNVKLVANIASATNINKAPESLITKDHRNEILSLFKNITKNIGDLKMLLRS